MDIEQDSAERLYFVVETKGGMFTDDLRGTEDLSPLIVGITASAIVGMIAIKGLLTYVQHRSYDVFAWYRFLFAIGLLSLYFTRQ